jgi:hypothetical protein
MISLRCHLSRVLVRALLGEREEAHVAPSESFPRAFRYGSFGTVTVTDKVDLWRSLVSGFSSWTFIGHTEWRDVMRLQRVYGEIPRCPVSILPKPVTSILRTSWRLGRHRLVPK